MGRSQTSSPGAYTSSAAGALTIVSHLSHEHRTDADLMVVSARETGPWKTHAVARKVQGRGMASTHQRAVAYDGLGALADEPLESDAWTAEKGLHIILQHRRLLELLRSIEDSVASEELGGWRGAAEPLLEEFIELLGNHFAAEVATTFPDLRAQGNPAYAERLARLDAEHPMLVQQFESVMRMLLDPRATRQEVQGALGGAADAFRRHEACENALFLDQS